MYREKDFWAYCEEKQGKYPAVIGIIKEFFDKLAINYPDLKMHCQRVAITARDAAGALCKDKPFTFLAGALHDIGKTKQPYELFDGHNVSLKEYEKIKCHARLGYEALKEADINLALVVGSSHALYRRNGYGIELKDFPPEMAMLEVKKVLDSAMIISACDFIDAYNNRRTKLLNQVKTVAVKLPELLRERFPNDQLIIGKCLDIYQALKF